MAKKKTAIISTYKIKVDQKGGTDANVKSTNN